MTIDRHRIAAPPISSVFYPSPPVQTLGDAVLIQGEALALVQRAVEIMHARNSGRRSSLVFDTLRRRLGHAMDVQAAMSSTRHDDTTLQESEPDSVLTEQIGTRAAAEILGLTQRQCQRLVIELGGARCSGRWMFTRDAVHALKAERAARTED
ncbi:hypothetical protein [Rhodococcus sp. IEGM 1330]|uniref:hypothetical protein n=1 Tax=Rhodococcus sp. IEGM 1330 TaxID=3082225 RepID=UPI0029544A81|nr:hypothetical protein [Rhodococcus sp. IEGM 1330]MDV8022006.1 hypothetical protein [Rhodococcus sp. IEGM 1330]